MKISNLCNVLISCLILDEQIKGRVRQAQTALRVHARPRSDELSGRVEDLHPEQIQFEIHSCEGVQDAIECVRENIRLLEDKNQVLNVPKYPVVTFLGTGSTFPSKYRSLSAILIETQPGKFVTETFGFKFYLIIHNSVFRPL